MQALGQHVRPEAELAGGGDDAIAGFLAQAAAVVECLGRGADRDTGKPRDIADRHTEPPDRRHPGRRPLAGTGSTTFFHRPALPYFTAPLRKPDM